MAQNFLTCDREQAYLMPPSLRDWLPAGPAGVVCARRGRRDGPVGDLRGLSRRWAWSRGVRSGDDGRAVAVRLRGRGALVAGDRAALPGRRGRSGWWRPTRRRITPRSRAFGSAIRSALASLFGQVLGMCGRAGLVSLGVIALDGTKVHGERVGASEPDLRADRGRDPGRGRRRRCRRGRAVWRGARRRVAARAGRSGLAQGRRLREAKRRLDDEQRAAQQAHQDKLAARAEREVEARSQAVGPQAQGAARAGRSARRG